MPTVLTRFTIESTYRYCRGSKDSAAAASEEAELAAGPRLFEGDAPETLERFVKVLAANARRYASTGSALNKELAGGVAQVMLKHLIERLYWWSYDLVGNGRMIDASLQGTQP